MRLIPLTQGQWALVDDADYEWLIAHTWCAHKCRGKIDKFYAVTHIRDETGKLKLVSMHRLITNCPKGMVVDHEDNNGLNNQRFNIRVCTHSQNQHNRGRDSDGRQKYKGVTIHKRNKTNPYQAAICVNWRNIYLGMYPTDVLAALAYDAAAREHHGEFAYQNFPEGVEIMACAA